MEIIQEDIQPVIEFAVKCHQGQKRKGSGLPYIVHPIAVLYQLADWKISCFKCWKAALCHDIIEDCPDVTFEELVEVIGLDATKIVQELTFKSDSGIAEKVQKSEYMKSFATKSIQALAIKIADRFCNTIDFISTNPDYAPKYWNKAKDLFETFEDRKADMIAEFGYDCFEKISSALRCMVPVLKQINEAN